MTLLETEYLKAVHGAAVSPVYALDRVIKRLWDTRKMNTADIAEHLRLAESFVVMRLGEIHRGEHL